MRNRLLRTFFPPKLPSYPTLVAWMDAWHVEWEALTDADKPSAWDYASEKLAEKMQINQLSESKLLEFGALCQQWTTEPYPISSRILFCGTKAQINAIQPGDTIITPEGVWQIDHTFQEQLILNKIELNQSISENLRPTIDSTLEVLPVQVGEDALQSQSLCSELNQAILKKGSGLYIATENSIQMIKDNLKTFQQKHMTQTLVKRDLSQVLLKPLQLQSDIQFIRFAHQLYLDCIKYFQNQGKALGADDVLPYVIDTQSKKIKLQTLSDADLKKLAYVCSLYDPPFSAKIHCAGSLEQLSDAKVCKLGHTFLLPDGVYQIDGTGSYRQVLNRETMLRTIPQQFIPKSTSAVTTTSCQNGYDGVDSDAVRFTQALNTALENTQPSAMYLGQTAAAEPKEIQDLVQAIHYLTQKELDRRQLKEPLILKAMGVKSDAEFMQFWQRIHRQFVENWEATHPETPHFTEKIYLEHLKTILPKYHRIHLDNLSDAELRTLYKQCQIWSPHLSPRIVCCHTIPEDSRIGDTLIMLTGVYQMHTNSSGKLTRETILSAHVLQQYPDLLASIPPNQAEVVVLDQYSNKQNKALLTVLREQLNSHVIKHPKGRYLADIENKPACSYGNMSMAIADLVAQEIQLRFQRTYQAQKLQKAYSLFRFRHKAAQVAPQPDAQQLQSTVQDLQTLQAQDPLVQSVQPSPAVMLIQSHAPTVLPRSLKEITTDVQQVIGGLRPAMGQNLKPQKNSARNSVQVLSYGQVMLEASAKSLAVYKPLLQAKIDGDPTHSNRLKALLFLKALGIPPTEGKDKIVIRGGYHALRKEIRSQFAALKDEELQKTSQSHINPFSPRNL